MEKPIVNIILFIATAMFMSCSYNYSSEIDRLGTEIHLFGADSMAATQIEKLCSHEIGRVGRNCFISGSEKNRLLSYFYTTEIYAFSSSGMISNALSVLDAYESEISDSIYIEMVRPCLLSYENFLNDDAYNERIHYLRLVNGYEAYCKRNQDAIRNSLRNYILDINGNHISQIYEAHHEYLEDYFLLRCNGLHTDAWAEYERYIREECGITADLNKYREEFLQKDDIVLGMFLPQNIYSRFLRNASLQ